MRRGPLVLAVLDGWGIAPPSKGNAVTSARTPTLQRWRTQYPWTSLDASGPAVGLAPGQDGNSEAGHMNIGSGRIAFQDNTRISQSITDGTFFRNPAFLAAIRHVKKRNSTLHIMGLLGSAQSAHSDPDHLLALLLLTQNQRLRDVQLHFFTDGRDSPRFQAREIITKFLPHFGDARVATIMGRWFAMDRNKYWDRTQLAYAAMTESQAPRRAPDALSAINQAYNRGESDEFIEPTVIGSYRGMSDGDAIIFFNLRSDRARQLTKTFVQPDFEAKNRSTGAFVRRKRIEHLLFVAMTDFGPDLGDLITAFPAENLRETLPMALHDLRQLYIAESEKYAHMTYFFNGGYAEPVGGEQRVMVPSPSVKYYDQTPAMSSQAITDRVCRDLAHDQVDFVALNYANTDMVAHTGNLSAAIAAMEYTDACLARLEETVRVRRGIFIVTADHGNIEEMIDPTTDEVNTDHSGNPVPFFLVGDGLEGVKLRNGGKLADIAPTILALLGRSKPPLMTGRSLVAV